MLRKSLPEIQRMCSALDLREAIVERSCMIYREAHRVGFLDKRCLELVAGASIYMACREQQLPRFPSEIVDVMRLTEDSTQGNRSPRSSLLRVYRKMWAADEMDINPKPLTPEECLPRFSAELDLGPRTRQIARNLLERVKETRVDGGRRPRTVAAGVIAAAVNEASIPEAAPQQSQVPAEHLADTKIMQSEIADVSEHSATTVREARREFVEELCMETVVQPVSSKDPKGREQAAVA